MKKEGKIEKLLKSKPKLRTGGEVAKPEPEEEGEVKSVMESIKLFSKNQRIAVEESAKLVVDARKLELPFVHINAGYDAKSFLMSGMKLGVFIDVSGGMRESINHSIHGLIKFIGGKDVEDDLTPEMRNSLLDGRPYFDRYKLTFNWFGEDKTIVYYIKDPFEYFGKVQEIKKGIGVLVTYNSVISPKVAEYMDAVVKGGLVLYKGRLCVESDLIGFQKLNEFFYDDGTPESNYYGILKKVEEVRVSSVEGWLELNEAISSLVFIEHEREEQVKTRLTIGKYQAELEEVDEAVERIKRLIHKLSKTEKESLGRIIDKFILNQNVAYGGKLEQNLKALVSYARTKLSEIGLTDYRKK